MKTFIPSAKTYFRKRQFYYRLLMPYLVLTILAVIVTGILGLWIIGSRYNNKIIDADKKNLQNIQTYTDETLYNSLLNIIHDTFLLNPTASSDGFSLDSFFSGTETTLLEDTRYLSYLNTLLTRNPFIDSITIYQNGQNFAISTDYGVTHHPDTSAAFQSRVPFHMYKKLAESSEKLIFSPLSSSNTMVLLRSVPLYSSLSDGQGFIAISIDTSAFLAQILERYPVNGGLMIYNPDHQLLLSVLPDASTNPDVFLDDIRDALSQNHTSLRSEQTKYSLSFSESSDSGWIYVSAVPWDQLTQESMTTFQIMGLSILATVALSLFIVHRITARIYHPLNTLRQKVARENNDPHVLASIQNTLVYLENQMDDMKHTLDQNKDLFLYKTMMDLLYSRQIDEQDIRKRLAMCQSPFSSPHFLIIIIAFDHDVFDSLEPEQREYIAVQAQNIPEQNLNQTMIHMTQSYPESRLVTILNLDELQYHAFLETQQNLLNEIMEKIPVRVNLAFSPLLSALSQIGRTYPSVCDYLKYTFLYGSGNIFSPELYASFESTAFSPTPKDYAELETGIRTGQFEAVTELLTQQKASILAQRPSYASVNSYLTQLYSITFRVGNEQSVFADKSKKQEALTAFQNASTFLQAMDSIQHILSMYQEVYNSKNHSFDSKLAASVIEYIRTHWQEELTLTSLSDRFSISSSHLSRLFKQVTGENLSVFVIQFKLEKAAELLVTRSDLSVKNIGELLGYYSSAYFTKLFKDHYGVTPSQYRRQHLL